MMSFKLAFKSMKKNLKDYVIYFLTLVLGVAIFYIFNSMDSQQAMLQLSESKRQIMDLMINVLGGVSIFVSFVLGFLIVYANNFLIKRRKKEFGLYMLLGMGKGQISRILLLETLLVGILSLGIGLIIGVFGAQLMSILVSQLFEADMTGYQFVFSAEALLKTIMYFAIIYLLVMVVNMIATNRYKLIDLLTANKKNEKVRLKNPVLSVLLFIIAVIILGTAYYMAINGVNDTTMNRIMIAISLGCLGTFLFFYSLSGFALQLVMTRKSLYLKDLNMFVLRQIHSKINTTVFSMSVISILLFLTICIFSSAMSLNNTLTEQLKELNPVDITISKQRDLTNEGISEKAIPYSQERIDDSKVGIEESLKNAGLDIQELFSEYVETTVYTTEQLMKQESMGDFWEQMKQEYSMVRLETPETIMEISDYNKIAKLYGHKTLTLGKNEYIIIANVEASIKMRNKALEAGTKITLEGKEYSPRFKECQDGFTSIAPQPMETGMFIVPDGTVKPEWRKQTVINANYKGNTEEEKQEIENKIVALGEDETVNMATWNNITALSKRTIYEASKGISATATFIGLYLGIIFLISSAAILALKELSDSSDNKQRYDILRKIGTDEKMINKALWRQVGTFYFIPLGLAIIHSIFGMKVASVVLATFGKQDLMSSIIMTAIFLVAIYGGYFIATYLGSKNIIKN